jgi:hypothetical protein
MNIRRFLCTATAFACFALVSTASWALDVSEWSYAAIAYAPSTGNFRYSYNYGSRYSAEQAALRGMSEKDAKIVCWVNRGFCALALGDDVGAYGTGWEYGDDASNTEAMDTALRNCRERTKGARIAICLVSDGQYIYEPKPPKVTTPVETKPAASASPLFPSFPEFNPLAPQSPSQFTPFKPFNSPFNNSPFDPFATKPNSSTLLPDSPLLPVAPQFTPFNPIVPQPNPFPNLINPEPSAVLP